MAEQQRVPNLQELDEQQAYRFLTELLSTKSRGLRGEPPRGLHHGDAPVGRSDKGPREHEEIPRGLPWRRAVAQVASSASKGEVVGRFPLFAGET